MAVPDLLVGTDDGLFSLGQQNLRTFAGRRVTALARDSERWWAIIDQHELWVSGGNDWERTTQVNDFKALSALPTAFGVFIGTSEAHLLKLNNGTLIRVTSFDAVEGREDWFTPWGGPPDTRSLTAGPAGILFANVHVGGVPRSTDAGDTWEPTMEIEADCHQVIAHPENASTVLAATAVGLGVSSDSGKRWRFVEEGLHATYQRAIAVSGDTVLVSSSRSERGRQAAVYRGKLGARMRLSKCEDGLPAWFIDNVDTGCLAAQGRAAALGTADGMVFVSSDLGERWTLLKEGLPRVRCVAFAQALIQSLGVSL